MEYRKGKRIAKGELNHAHGNARCAILTLLALAFLDRAAPASEQSNILFIFCDDLTIQAVSADSNPLKLLETPKIDRLAQEGILAKYYTPATNNEVLKQ